MTPSCAPRAVACRFCASASRSTTARGTSRPASGRTAIEGKLRYSSWETQDGQRRSKLEVVVDEVEFLSSRNQGGAGAPAPAQYQQQGGYQQAAPSYNAPAPAPAQRPVQTPPAADVYDEDIPF